MSFIIPTGWTRHEGFPQITGAGSDITLVDEFFADYDLTDVFSKIPFSGSLYDEENIVPQLSTLRLSTYAVNPTATKNNAIITLTYQPSHSNVPPEENIAEWFLENNTIDKPLESAQEPEQPEDYLTMWNYNLYEFVEENAGPSELPTWATDATDKSDGKEDNVEGAYQWAKEKPSGGYQQDGSTYDWYKVQDMSKPGQESFIIAAPVIQERVHYRSKLSASEAASTVGQIETPTETYGKEDGEWLVMSATIQRDGRRYLVEKTFQWANEWDSDLYATS
jgi:hypothetical protein